MWMKRTKTKSALIALGLILGATGCAGPSTNENDPGSATLNVGVATLPTSLDPGKATYRQQGMILKLAAGTLTNVDRGGKNVSMGLAAEMEQDDRKVIFKLKPGLKFSDGSPLTAADVAATFDHYLADKSYAYGYYFEPVAKVKATDELTVEFELKRPYPSLPGLLANQAAAIFPAKSIESKGADLFKGDPLPSAGQFMVQSLSQDQITLQANPNFAGNKSSTKTIIFKKITDPASRLAQLQGGQIDYADDITPKSVAQFSSPVKPVTAAAINGEQFMVMNNRPTNTLSDVRIRQAISIAINRNQINQVAWAGQAHPPLSLFPSPGTDNANFLHSDADTQRAKELLVGTSCANGCTLRLVVASDNEPRSDAAAVLQQNLKAIGIQVNIEKSQSATVSTYLRGANFDLAIAGCYDQTPDTYLDYLLGSSVSALYSGYSSPEMDRLLEQVGIESGSGLAATIGQINALFAKDMPMTPIADFSVTSASRVPAERFTMDAGFLFYVG